MKLKRLGVKSLTTLEVVIEVADGTIHEAGTRHNRSGEREHV